jgi:transcriptional regulator with XRE-family HTH domain
MLDDTRKTKIQEGFARLRKERNLTQEEVGHALGKSKAHVRNLEGGQSLPPAVVDVIAIAKLFGVSTDYLLGLTQVPTPRSQELDEQSELLLARFGMLPEHRRNELLAIVEVITQAAKEEQQWRGKFRDSVSVLRERATDKEVADILEQVLSSFD